MTVLATLLPVGGASSAAFVARLIYRLADFITPALAVHDRVLSWAEVISGMQRMYLVSEIMEALIGPPEPHDSPRGLIQTAANMDINLGNSAWFENFLSRVADHIGMEYSLVEAKALRAISRSEAIRYAQLGHPESILIDDGRIRSKFVPPHLMKYGQRDDQKLERNE